METCCDFLFRRWNKPSAGVFALVHACKNYRKGMILFPKYTCTKTLHNAFVQVLKHFYDFWNKGVILDRFKTGQFLEWLLKLRFPIKTLRRNKLKPCESYLEINPRKRTKYNSILLFFRSFAHDVMLTPRTPEPLHNDGPPRESTVIFWQVFFPPDRLIQRALPTQLQQGNRTTISERLCG